MPVKGIAELRPALIAIGFMQMAATCFTYPLYPFTYAAIFLAAFSVYLADHTLPAKHKSTWPVLLITSALFFYSALSTPQLNGVVISGYVCLSLLYVLPVFHDKRRLQDFPKIRVATVVLAWACVPAVINNFHPFTPTSFRYLIGMSGFMLAALLWSDLADAKDDQKTGRHTWSTQLRPNTRYGIIVSALIASLFCFSLPDLRPMLPGPLLYLIASPYLNRQPQYSDWFLLWPLVGSLTN